LAALLATAQPAVDGNAASSFPTNYRRSIAWGWAVAGLCFGGLGLWSALAPLSAAVIAAGTVVVDGSRKSVQHLEGGIVRQILVRDGDAVQAGQVLIRLDDTVQQNALSLVQARLDADLATESRLVAERDDRATPAFPPDLTRRAASSGDVRQMLDGQSNIFRARHDTLTGQVSILQNRIAQSNEEIAGLDIQQKAKTRQVELLRRELAGLTTLLQKGYAPETKVLAVQREIAELEGTIGESMAKVASVRQAIDEARLQITQLRKTFLESVAGELRQTQTEILDLAQRAAGAREEIARLAVLAPVDGVAVDLAVHTIGGVIAPGSRIVDVVPQNQPLMIEAQVRPVDIDQLHPGLGADIRFPAFKRGNTPVIRGAVATVSADRLVDPRTSAPYYMVRLIVPGDERSKLAGLQLVPGMPAEVIVRKGDRTLLNYLLGPLEDTVVRAFRE
jgi:HlyD family secretion protein/epimerase transport system membrane fusion protein